MDHFLGFEYRVAFVILNEGSKVMSTEIKSGVTPTLSAAIRWLGGIVMSLEFLNCWSL